jgi:hypothetical protein
MTAPDEWYLDQPVRVPGKDHPVRVKSLTKTLVHLADGSRWRRCDGRPCAHASAHIEPWSAEHTRSAQLARRLVARAARRRSFVPVTQREAA